MEIEDNILNDIVIGGVLMSSVTTDEVKEKIKHTTDERELKFLERCLLIIEARDYKKGE